MAWSTNRHTPNDATGANTHRKVEIDTMNNGRKS